MTERVIGAVSRCSAIRMEVLAILGVSLIHWCHWKHNIQQGTGTGLIKRYHSDQRLPESDCEKYIRRSCRVYQLGRRSRLELLLQSTNHCTHSSLIPWFEISPNGMIGTRTSTLLLYRQRGRYRQLHPTGKSISLKQGARSSCC